MIRRARLPRKRKGNVRAGRPRSAGSLSQLAYRRVLAGLFNRSIPTGAFVSQKTLVNLLRVPLQPLRDALRVLEAEGIVTIHPRSGLQFLRPDMEFVHNTYQFRALIERAAARRFAESATDGTIRRLIDEHQKLLTEIKTHGFQASERQRLAALDGEFHSELMRNLRNPLLETAAQRLQNYVALIKVDRVMTKPFALRTIQEHLQVLHACEKREPELAEQALLEHFQAALGRMMGTI